MDILNSNFYGPMVDYLRNSQCGFENKIPKVCCTSDDPRERTRTTERPRVVAPVQNAPYLEKLKRIFPAPPKCGYQPLDLQDKIFGGSETKIDEFPWIVPLFYETRKES